MELPRGLRVLLGVFIAASLLLGSVSCGPGAGPAATDQSADLATLKQQVAAQEKRIAALETKVALPQPTAILPQPVATPTARPTPTIVPPVAGLVTDGATKGVADAKVTITEYLDYL